MTQSNQQQQTVPNAVLISPRDTSMSPSQSLRPSTDSPSDNDNSEKPVREKLKKTSLASMSNHVVERQEMALKPNEEKSETDLVDRGSLLGKDIDKEAVEPRGRPVKKRSFDYLDTPEAESIEAGREHVAEPYPNGHLRKRSRDVRVGEIPMENRRPLLAGTPVREESEDTENGFETNQAYNNVPENAVDNQPPGIESQSQVETEQHQQFQDLSGSPQSVSRTVQGAHVTGTSKESSDQEMRESASTPQKKRSRDQFDTEADREQKIHATEEARAHRRSEELERNEVSTRRTRSPLPTESFGSAGKRPVTLEEEKGLVPHLRMERQERSFKSAFGSASTFSPSMNLARSDFPANISSFVAKATDQESQTSGDAFASSSFAPLAGSSTSPFGILGGSSTAATGTPFASQGFSSGKTVTDKHEALKSKAASNGGFNTTAFGSTDQSLFGSSGLSKSSVLAGSVFGSAFGGSLGGGSRLTSFAAPSGDAKLGIGNGVIKPIGSPKHDEDEDENSESEAEGVAESKKDEETQGADGRFQHQDVETGEGGEDSIFSSRASLYSFRDNAWKESGKGIFKLNIAPASPEVASSDKKTGRFIMRAHQTYRVLLNVPVFKQMQVGDSRGKEPSGKSFLFAVIENAKPVAHMLKMSDATDSKTLYHEVRSLQKGLE